MADDLGSDLDQFFPHRTQGPIVYGLGQCQPPQEVTNVVRHTEQLQPNLIIIKIMAGQPCPFQSILALFDPLLRCSTLVIKLDHIAVFPSKVRHDKTDSGE